MFEGFVFMELYEYFEGPELKVRIMTVLCRFETSRYLAYFQKNLKLLISKLTQSTRKQKSHNFARSNKQLPTLWNLIHISRW